MPEHRDLSGIVQPGRGLAVSRMADREVMQKVQELAGFPVVPGTLNVRLPAPLDGGPSWRYVPAGGIAPDWRNDPARLGTSCQMSRSPIVIAASRSRPAAGACAPTR
jgi:hypothetical protein